MISPAQARDKQKANEAAKLTTVFTEAEDYIDPFLERGDYRVDMLRGLRPYMDAIAARYREQGWNVTVSGTHLVFAEPPAEGNDR